MFKYKLGLGVEDKVTGFSGVITGRADYITGCAQYVVQPKGSVDKMPAAKWIDEGRLKVNKLVISIKPEDVQGDEAGGPQENQAPTK